MHCKLALLHGNCSWHRQMNQQQVARLTELQLHVTGLTDGRAPRVREMAAVEDRNHR